MSRSGLAKPLRPILKKKIKNIDCLVQILIHCLCALEGSLIAFNCLWCWALGWGGLLGSYPFASWNAIPNRIENVAFLLACCAVVPYLDFVQ